MIARLRGMLHRAKDVGQTEGLRPLMKRAFDFYVFQHGRYYLYEHSLVERAEADFMPRIEDVALTVVHSNAEADELAASTGQDFRRLTLNARRGLNNGAVFFCFLVNGELAHVGWVAIRDRARVAMGSVPQKVDFSDGVAFTGGTETVPKYRAEGLMVYGYFKRFEYLREKGFRASRNAVSVENVASHKAHSKFGPHIYARARYVKLLGGEFWKETPIGPGGGPA
jgi:hypothetical protein